MLFLDSRQRILGAEAMFRGSLTGATIHIREIAKMALAYNACSLIVAHNHPSGDPSPSSADISITTRLRDGLHLLDIRLLDHLVIGSESAVSMAARGLF